MTVLSKCERVVCVCVRERVVCKLRRETAGAGNGRWEAGGGTGVHNQKPEPHTKMWEDATQTHLMDFFLEQRWIVLIYWYMLYKYICVSRTIGLK